MTTPPPFAALARDVPGAVAEILRHLRRILTRDVVVRTTRSDGVEILRSLGRLKCNSENTGKYRGADRFHARSRFVKRAAGIQYCRIMDDRLQRLSRESQGIAQSARRLPDEGRQGPRDLRAIRPFFTFSYAIFAFWAAAYTKTTKVKYFPSPVT